jgi:4'-phosphopantetheinyl transferase EntD
VSLPPAEEIESIFRNLLPPEARVVAVAVADAPADWPVPSELQKARTSRQREFIAGRWCAARVLSLLGVVGTIGRRDDRAPQWPLGVIGSISHTPKIAVAAGARATLTGLGIDVEPLVSAEALRELRSSAIDDEEWRLLGADPALATVLFSAKETLFKCENPRTGVWLEFHEATLVAKDAEALTLRFAAGERRVRYVLAYGHAFTALAVA